MNGEGENPKTANGSLRSFMQLFPQAVFVVTTGYALSVLFGMSKMLVIMILFWEKSNGDHKIRFADSLLLSELCKSGPFGAISGIVSSMLN